MAAPAEIPGFYYDTEKNKYFRVLPHHAAPTPSFYSSSSVRQQERDKQRDKEHREEVAQRLKSKRHSPLKSNSYVKATLYRELSGIASSTEHAEDLRQVYAQGLRRQRVFEVDPGRKICAFAPDTSGGRTAVIIGTSAGDVRILPMEETVDGALRVNTMGICPLIHSYSQVTSISISSQRCLMATFMGERHCPMIYLTRLANPETPIIPHHYPGLQHSFDRRTHIRSIWTSTASPSPSGDLLLGTSGSAVHIIPHPHQLQQTDYRLKSDVFAVEFLPATPYSFLCGSRDGDMRLFDVRAPSLCRPDITVRHGSTVTHIRALSNTTVAVNGLQRCALYDLRFPHPSSPSSAFAQATRAQRVFANATRKGEFMIGLGFDVDVVRGVMAVADHEHMVQLYSLATGEKLQSVAGRERWAQPCKGLRFDRAVEPGRLWAGEGQALDYFAF